jgi:hypothetical protein
MVSPVSADDSTKQVEEYAVGEDGQLVITAIAEFF